MQALATAYACRPSILHRVVQYRWLLGSAALVLFAAGFAWQWSWLVAIGVAPLLISVAPCVAMCALGLCMHRMGNRAGAATQSTSTARVTSEDILQQQER